MTSLKEYIDKHYTNLTRYASPFTDCPTDLVHFTYIKMIDAGFQFRDEPSTDSYFKRAIKQNGIHSFKKIYLIKDNPEVENIAEEHDIERRVAIEKLDVVIRCLDEFDRQVTELYLRGENMSLIAKESGVPASTIYHALSKVRKLLKSNA